jgi:hypothetical protein
MVESLWQQLPHEWYTDNYTKKQNEMHAPYLDGWRKWVADANVKLGSHFKYDYPTNGASEGIQHLMASHATSKYLVGGKPVIHVFEGEYEGYRKVAEALNLTVRTHKRHDYENIKHCSLDRDVFWISQPSAIDGNVWPEFPNFIQWMNKNLPGVRIVVDLTYVGAVAKEYEIVLTSPNIKAVLWSLSKPFGVYYHRIGGISSAVELPSLYGNYWFKNLFSLHLGTALMEAYGPHDLPRKYAAEQASTIQGVKFSAQRICHRQISVVPSDVVILAHQKFEPTEVFDEEYIRVKNDNEVISRYCLTPGMDLSINYEFIRKTLDEKLSKTL